MGELDVHNSEGARQRHGDGELRLRFFGGGIVRELNLTAKASTA